MCILIGFCRLLRTLMPVLDEYYTARLTHSCSERNFRSNFRRTTSRPGPSSAQFQAPSLPLQPFSESTGSLLLCPFSAALCHSAVFPPQPHPLAFDGEKPPPEAAEALRSKKVPACLDPLEILADAGGVRSVAGRAGSRPKDEGRVSAANRQEVNKFTYFSSLAAVVEDG